jgi:hypothetical protein
MNNKRKKKEKHESPKRNPSVFEEGASSKLFPCEN